MTDRPTWRAVSSRVNREPEVLANDDIIANGWHIAIVEDFGHGWIANAVPPNADGTYRIIPGMIRGGNFGDEVEAAKAWCERICGLSPEIASDRVLEEPL